MIPSSKHPDRNALLKAIKTENKSILRHLEECEMCNDIYQLLLLTNIGQLRYEPPKDLITRCKRIPLMIESRKPLKHSKGTVQFDSWKNMPALAVRQAPFGIERRIRFIFKQFTFEFVGSRYTEGWNFIGRVYKDELVNSEFILQVGSKKIHLGNDDCFHWVAKHPPHRLKLLSKEIGIDLGSLQW